ncbi:MAG: MlaD family protein, partial [Candidatus Methylomirabilia bacterium]
MRHLTLELGVGVFMVISLLSLGYVSIKLGQVNLWGSGGYLVTADFPSAGGLRSGSTVEIAGVEIGRVESLGLADYQA